MPVAYRRLRHLRDQCLCVTQQQQLHPAVAMELFLELLSDQPVGMSGALYDRPARSGFTTHEQRHADETLVAYHRDFRRGTVCQYVQQRYDRVSRKINVAQEVAGFIQDLAE